MGQDQSVINDDTPSETLRERSLAAVAEYIKSGQARRVVVMTGAGISTAAGIPDFRSPETGLYANLAKLNLPEPEAVFDLRFFEKNPKPFYVLAKDLYPGNFHPTVSHVFISLLAKKGLLHQLFTQNIDCLERAAGIPSELIVEAHGSFASQRCIECKTSYPEDLMREHVARADVPRCIRGTECGGLVKPDIVFFHEALPSLFYERKDLVEKADLALVMGTSLQVHPFAGLPNYVPEGVPRVLFNMERVGSLGTQADDVLALGDCDAGVRELADLLGWREDLEAEWRSLVGEEEAQRQLSGRKKLSFPVRVKKPKSANTKPSQKAHKKAPRHPQWGRLAKKERRIKQQSHLTRFIKSMPTYLMGQPLDTWMMMSKILARRKKLLAKEMCQQKEVTAYLERTKKRQRSQKLRRRIRRLSKRVRFWAPGVVILKGEPLA
ncbi:DHS-like NAD/FAD-binding domain-containing protein [Lasiosphaeria hispida]|uniref:DHS-like NAD/FAD-binding domain-containing protein n=1 Tax=Lasiosphaeria hispida TaxID=260671 RepID=A0AAJ0HV48_9PEZI|nr:DHS-like NAD/FAD-binding domain-containing protein [Lasiosphaeria hispida]